MACYLSHSAAPLRAWRFLSFGTGFQCCRLTSVPYTACMYVRKITSFPFHLDLLLNYTMKTIIEFLPDGQHLGWVQTSGKPIKLFSPTFLGFKWAMNELQLTLSGEAVNGALSPRLITQDLHSCVWITSGKGIEVLPWKSIKWKARLSRATK